ncbi:MAG: oxidoreductase [Actinomycetota bacterium]|nr:oxidoreductase [Actinomycetota bacterium]
MVPVVTQRAISVPDQSGRTALVTGANSGLGLETAAVLAERGAHVLLAGRSPERLEAALSNVRARAPHVFVGSLVFDLASLVSVRHAADTVLAATDRLDLLVDNAGVMAIPRSETEDGFETQFGTNHLGHFALTGLLLPALLPTKGSRVVVVTSFMRLFGRIDFADPHGRAHYGRWKAYCQSKLANVLFAEELERRLRATFGAETVAVPAHPGYAATNLQRGTSLLHNATLGAANRIFAQSAEAGAWPQLYAATAPAVRGGELYGPGHLGGLRGLPRRKSLDPRSKDLDAARRLWELSVEETGVDYAVLARGGAPGP